MFVAWRGRAPAVVRAASRPAGPRRFARSVVLDGAAGAVSAPGVLALGLAPTGGATVVWSRPQTSEGLPVFVVRAATATSDGRFASPVDVPGAFGAAAAVDYDARGGMLVTWIQEVAG